MLPLWANKNEYIQTIKYKNNMKNK